MDQSSIMIREDLEGGPGLRRDDKACCGDCREELGCPQHNGPTIPLTSSKGRDLYSVTEYKLVEEGKCDIIVADPSSFITFT